MSHSRRGSWLVPGRDHQDWQPEPDPFLHPRAGRRAEATVLWHERFSNTTTKEYVCMVQLVSPVQRASGDGEMAERDSGVGGFCYAGILLCRKWAREGEDLANWSLHYHHPHLPGNRKKNNLVGIVQFAEATSSCFSQKALCEGISPRLWDPLSWLKPSRQQSIAKPLTHSSLPVGWGG